MDIRHLTTFPGYLGPKKVISTPSKLATSIARQTIFPNTPINHLTRKSPSSQQQLANTFPDPSHLSRDSTNDQPSAWVLPPGGIWSLYKSTYTVYPGEPYGEGFFAAHRIGDPSFSQLLIKHLVTNTKYSPDKQARIERQFALLRRCNHLNIISFQGIFEDFLVFRDIIRTFLNALIECLELREQHTAVIFRELIQGLSYIHEMEISHGAIAPPNILFSDSGDLVICMDSATEMRLGVLLTVGSKLRGGRE